MKRSCALKNKSRRFAQCGSGLPSHIDLSYGKSMWHLGRSKSLPKQHDRVLFENGEAITIQMPLSVSEDDSGMTTLYIIGPIPMSGLFRSITGKYDEFKYKVTYAEMAGGEYLSSLDKIGANTYELKVV